MSNIMNPDTKVLATVPEIENVDALLQFLDTADVTDEQRQVIPLLWFQYSVKEASRTTGISPGKIYEWLNEPSFAYVVKEGRSRRREMLSKYLYQAGYQSFGKIMDLLSEDYDPHDEKMVREQQKTARFVIGEIGIEPDRVEHIVDTRVLHVAKDVEERMAEKMAGQVVDAMPKLLAMECVDSVTNMSVMPKSSRLNVYESGGNYLVQCHKCIGWFSDLAEHLEQHDMSKRKYAQKFGVPLEVFDAASYIC